MCDSIKYTYKYENSSRHLWLVCYQHGRIGEQQKMEINSTLIGKRTEKLQLMDKYNSHVCFFNNHLVVRDNDDQVH